jgi:hypothetical protein
MSDTTVTGLKMPPLSDARASLCMEANFQIDSMARALRQASRGGGDSIDQLPYLVRGMMTRVIELNDALMNALGLDPSLTDQELHNTVHGVDVDASHG